jgi:hypothetical protein
MQFLLTLEISERLVCLFEKKYLEFRSSFPFRIFFYLYNFEKHSIWTGQCLIASPEAVKFAENETPRHSVYRSKPLDAVSSDTGDFRTPGLLFYYLKISILNLDHHFHLECYLLYTIFKNIQFWQASVWLLALKLLNWLRMKRHVIPWIDQILYFVL